MSNREANTIRKRSGTVHAKTVNMSHGSGGKVMRDLIDDVFRATFDNDELNKLDDQARFKIDDLAAQGNRLAMTTDSYVVDPLFFPGGDIGKLAVNGTINDLAVGGALPRYLSCAVILEEGLPIKQLRIIAHSMKQAAEDADVQIVTGDTKVVPAGAADKLFINTCGIGVIPQNVDLSVNRIQSGDVILVNGFIGDHGAAIVDARGDMMLENTIQTDCQALNSLAVKMLETCPEIHCMRDATRGGIATVLNEFAVESNSCIRVDERSIPIREEVRGMCEILGLDPLYLANEGKLLAAVPAQQADKLLNTMQNHPAGKNSSIVARVSEKPESTVILSTLFGGERIVDMLVGEQLPRIC